MKPLEASVTRPLEGGASFPLRHRVLRLVWASIWSLLASWTPPMFLPWRRALLRLFGAKIASKANIYGSVRIWYPPNLEMDDYACLGPQVECYCMARITLGRHALVSQGAHLCAGTHDIRDQHFQLITRPIVLGAKSWVAAGAFVGPGVKIGEGAVLGAYGVTFQDLDPWMIYAGNRARFLGERKLRDGLADG